MKHYNYRDIQNTRRIFYLYNLSLGLLCSFGLQIHTQSSFVMNTMESAMLNLVKRRLARAQHVDAKYVAHQFSLIKSAAVKLRYYTLFISIND